MEVRLSGRHFGDSLLLLQHPRSAKLVFIMRKDGRNHTSLSLSHEARRNLARLHNAIARRHISTANIQSLFRLLGRVPAATLEASNRWFEVAAA
jgi:hypothetical protein